MRALLLLSLLAPALAGTVHEDIKSRFRVDLPEGWKWNPQPGDTLGTWFRKTDTGAFGNFGVRVIKLDKDSTLQKLTSEAEVTILDEPGYRKLAEVPVTVAGRPATRREYTMFVAGSASTQRRAEDYFLQNGDTAFWLHFEALAEGYDLFREDIQKLLDSFVPLAGGGPAALVGGKAAQLIGRWQKIGDTALIMELRQDGTYTLAEAHGTYGVERTSLVLRVPSQGEERFNFALAADELTLTGGSLDEPVRYRRMGALKKSTKIAGFWKPRDKNIGTLRLSPGGQFNFGNLNGNYRQKGDLLVFRRGEVEVIYTYFLDGDILKLSGGDLGGEVVFERSAK